MGELVSLRSSVSPHADSLLGRLQFQGQRNDCGPFTTATVLNAMKNLELDGVNLAKTMDKPVMRGILPVVRRVPGWATFPWGMVDMFREYGLKANWRFLSPQEKLIEWLDAGVVVMPIIGEWRPSAWMHVMTLVAVDPEKGWGFANTQYEHHNIHWLGQEYFMGHWKNTGRLVVTAQDRSAEDRPDY